MSETRGNLIIRTRFNKPQKVFIGPSDWIQVSLADWSAVCLFCKSGITMQMKLDLSNNKAAHVLEIFDKTTITLTRDTSSISIIINAEKSVKILRDGAVEKS